MAVTCSVTAFYSNGSITLDNKDTGEPITLSGAEALALFVAKLGEVGVSLQNGYTRLQLQNFIFDAIRLALRDPTAEALEVLELSAGASADEVKRAYKKLALKYHPDKQSSVENTVRKDTDKAMQRVNWAKEVLLKKIND